MNATSRVRNYDDFLPIIEIRQAAELLSNAEWIDEEVAGGGSRKKGKSELLIIAEGLGTVVCV